MRARSALGRQGAHRNQPVQWRTRLRPAGRRRRHHRRPGRQAPGAHAAQGRRVRHGQPALRSAARRRPTNPRAAGREAAARRRRGRIMRFRRTDPNAPPKPQRSTPGRMIIAALAGAASVFAFAPFGWWPVEILALAVLFYQVLRGSTVKSGALIGWAFGFGWTAAGTYWLYVSLHYYGDMAAPIAAAAVALLAFGMGFYVALAMGAAAWLRKRWLLPLPAANVLVLPAMWGVFEWIRGWLFTGFPWLSAGYAHNHSPLAGYAPLVGVYGLGWLAALCAGALLLLAHRTRWIATGGIVALMGAGYGLGFVQWTQPEGQAISIRLLQGNIPQDEKFNGAHVQATLKLYQDMITAAPADLIATPATAATSYYRYDKHHLVPYGEFIPYGFRWFVNLMSIPLGDITSGANLQPSLDR